MKISKIKNKSMNEFDCNLLGKKRKSNTNLFKTEIEEPFSTKFKSSPCPSPIPYQYLPINEGFLSNDEILSPHNVKDDDSINQSLNFSYSFTLKDDFKFKENEDKNLIFIQNNNFINFINNNENLETSNIEIYECRNILNQIREKIFYGIVINNKKGRKKKEQKEKGFKGLHNKYSKDNKLRKVKVLAFEAIFRTINSLLKIVDENKQIKRLNNEQIKELKVSYNLILLNNKIKYIFSDKISTKYVDESDYNVNMINSIYEEKEKYEEAIKILDKTLEECFRDFRDKENENELKKTLIKVIDERLKNKEKEYIDDIWKIIFNYEKIFREIKKPRTSKKKLNKE